MEGYAEQGARTDSTDQIGFGGARRNRKKRRGLTVFQLKVIGAVALALSAGSTTIVAAVLRLRYQQYDVADGDGPERSGVLVRHSDLRVAAGAGFP